MSLHVGDWRPGVNERKDKKEMKVGDWRPGVNERKDKKEMKVGDWRPFQLTVLSPS
jgi:hypothetical protein